MDTRIRQPGAFYYVMQDNLRILFVDDDPILREFAAVHLATENVEVETAGDGVEALEKIRERQPDLVLLDLEMPRMDGFELLRALRADPATLRLPVLVVTGREDVAAIDRAFEAGATSFVSKPINWRLLSYQVRYVHRTHRNEMALLEERSRARSSGEKTRRMMNRVATESSKFLVAALSAHPDLKPKAAAFAAALGAAADPDFADDAPDALAAQEDPTVRIADDEEAA